MLTLTIRRGSRLMLAITTSTANPATLSSRPRPCVSQFARRSPGDSTYSIRPSATSLLSDFEPIVGETCQSDDDGDDFQAFSPTTVDAPFRSHAAAKQHGRTTSESPAFSLESAGSDDR